MKFDAKFGGGCQRPTDEQLEQEITWRTLTWTLHQCESRGANSFYTCIDKMYDLIGFLCSSYHYMYFYYYLFLVMKPRFPQKCPRHCSL